MLENFLPWLSGQVDALQVKYPPNRIVAILMVALGAPLAGLAAIAAVWVPRHFPGLPAFTGAQYTAFFITGAGVVALAVVTAGNKFIDGVQKNELNTIRAADGAAARDHAVQLESMRLESQERQSAIIHASSAEHALDLLGLSPGDKVVDPPTVPGIDLQSSPPKIMTGGGVSLEPHRAEDEVVRDSITAISEQPQPVGLPPAEGPEAEV